MNHATTRVPNTSYRTSADPDVALGVECAHPAELEARLAGAGATLGGSGARTGKGRNGAIGFALAALLLAAGAWQFGQGVYLYGKANLAQALIARAWERTLAGEQQAKPWPWADTFPVARMSVRERNVDLYVLSGANGRSIAFGPGHVSGTPLPGEPGNSAIGGHRDTHLAFLKDLQPGNEIVVQRRDGARRAYRVNFAQVLNKKETWVLKNEGPSRLTLITCWPFNALRAGGPDRYVVSARMSDAALR